MSNKPFNLVKLGLFVLAGLLFLIMLLFMIGQNENMFGSTYLLKTQVNNAGGVRAGNNVRYAGIEVGTVKKIEILNDTLIEISMVIQNDMKKVIRKNAVVTLGTDGLIGNKVVNIEPGSGNAGFAIHNDQLPFRSAINIETMMRTLSGSNVNLEDITKELKITMSRINNSAGVWKILNDTLLAEGLRKSAKNLEKATANAENMTSDLKAIVGDVRAGKGSLGALIKDTGLTHNVNATIIQLQSVATEAELLARNLDQLTKNIDNEIQNGTGPVHLALKDTATAGSISRSVVNIEKGTEAFNQNMEAAKHNFLFRGYFKKQEKEKQKTEKEKQKSQ